MYMLVLTYCIPSKKIELLAKGNYINKWSPSSSDQQEGSEGFGF